MAWIKTTCYVWDEDYSSWREADIRSRELQDEYGVPTEVQANLKSIRYEIFTHGKPEQQESTEEK